MSLPLHLSSTPPKTIILLGAGVSALQTALSLLTSPLTSHHNLILIATHTPGDESIEYTSPWAGGHWRSHVGMAEKEKEQREWDARTYTVWRGMILNGDGYENIETETMEARTRRIGLGIKTCKYFFAHPTPETITNGNGLWWRDLVAGFKTLDCAQDEDRPKHTKAVFGIQYESICINVPRYLVYLMEMVEALGAKVIKATFDTNNGLLGVIQDVTKLALQHTPDLQPSSTAAVINCTGLSARHFLPPSEAEKLYPVRGQTILVKGEAKMARTFVGLGGDEELAYVIPRPGSGTTVLGGVKQKGVWDGVVDTEVNGRILDVLGREGLCEELKKEGDEFEILGYQVGLRPGREGGPRVDVEKVHGVNEDGRVDGVWMIHNYGHAGAGYQNSVGCAEKVVGLVVECGI